MGYNPLVNALNPQTNAIRVEGNLSIASTQTDRDAVNSATDLSTVITYLDQGLADHRVNTIVYSSVSIGKTYTETFNYGGVAGNYYITSITSI